MICKVGKEGEVAIEVIHQQGEVKLDVVEAGTSKVKGGFL